MCAVKPGQRLGKLTGAQTAEIIKHAAKKPHEHKQFVEGALRTSGLDHPDSTLTRFGLQVTMRGRAVLRTHTHFGDEHVYECGACRLVKAKYGAEHEGGGAKDFSLSC